MTVTPLGALRRTHLCGALRASDAGTSVLLLGWVHTIRDHGGVVFLDLRDASGVTQVVIEPQTVAPEVLETARQLGTEYVVAVRGDVRPRPSGLVNAKLATGAIEIRGTELSLLSTCKNLPFPINDDELADRVDEDLRLRYRYLDLRRASLQNTLRLRHRVLFRVREALNGEGFNEIETPLLVRPTPEGARDFIVPSRLHPSRFYALPQSPQLYKQILMIAGFDRYFQIARCLRDEDLRADRQPEHTQIDLEMTFVGEDDVWGVVERMFESVLQELPGAKYAMPFQRLSYADAMARFGSDKPDMRFGLELQDVAAIALRTEATIFRKAIEGGGAVCCLAVPASHPLSRKDIEGLEAVAKTYGAGGLAWARVGDAGALDGGVAKFFTGDTAAEIVAATGAEAGGTLLFGAGIKAIVQRSLGAVRLELGRKIYNPDPLDLRFVWIRDFPLFERDDERGAWSPAHHLFCMPKDEDIDKLETDPGAVSCRQYDLALNGVELGSGSIRIHSSELQRRVMKVVGLTEADAKEKFGFLLEALDYGAPPHGGIALGVDRIIMMLANRDSIRDTIAFPKTARATSLMDGAPGHVDQRDLDVLHIELDAKAKAAVSAGLD